MKTGIIGENIPDYKCNNGLQVVLDKSANQIIVRLPIPGPGLFFTFKKTGDVDIVIR